MKETITVHMDAEAYVWACTALLMAIATNSTITDAEVDVLLEAMPDVDMRDGLRVGLDVAGLRNTAYARTLR